MEIKNRILNEKIDQLKKGLEIVGEKSNFLLEDNTQILNYIIEKTFNEGIVKFTINNNDYTINELIKFKQSYEIYFLKNKLTSLNSIVYKIKKYDTSLDSLISFNCSTSTSISPVAILAFLLSLSTIVPLISITYSLFNMRNPGILTECCIALTPLFTKFQVLKG